jgi:hypothetical protein
MDERTYMVGSEDENGDQHVFMSEDFERAIAALAAMQERYGNVMTNAGLKEAMRD